MSAASQASSGESDLFTWFLTAAIGVAIWLGTVGWIVARAGLVLSGAVFTGRRPEAGVGFGGSLRSVAGSFADPGDPAGAWPAAWQGVVGGPVRYWSTFVVAGVVVGAVLGWTVWRVRGWFVPSVGLQRGDRLGQDASTALATKHELAPLAVDAPHGARLLLGSDIGSGVLLAAESGWLDDDADVVPSWAVKRRGVHRGARGGVALIGVSQSGKSRAVQAAINRWDGPAVIVSVKADMLAPTWAARSTVGEAKVFDPGEAIDDTTGRVSWNPLNGVCDEAGLARFDRARQVARDLGVTRQGPEVKGSARFWAEKGLDFVAALLWYCEFTGREMRDALTLSRSASFAVLVDELDRIAGAPSHVNAVDARSAAEFLREVDATDGEQRGSFMISASSVLSAWQNPAVLRQTSGRTADQATARWLLSGSNTLYLVSPVSGQDEVAPVVAGLLSQVRRQIEHAYAKSDRAFVPPVLMVLDEAGNMPLSWLPGWVSTCAAMGVQLVTVWQSKAQIDAAYGPLADSVVTNHRSKLFFAGNSDLATLEYASKLIGQEEVATRGVSSGDGRRNVSDQATTTVFAPQHLLRTMRPGEAVLIHSTLPPAHVRTLTPDSALPATGDPSDRSSITARLHRVVSERARHTTPPKEHPMSDQPAPEPFEVITLSAADVAIPDVSARVDHDPDTDWQALEAFAAAAQTSRSSDVVIDPADFMWMEARTDNDGQVWHAYKHRNTRRTIHCCATGTAARTVNGELTSLDPAEAAVWVLS